MMLKCYYAKDDDKCFTEGQFYDVRVGWDENTDEQFHYVVDDEDDEHEIDVTQEADKEWRPLSSSARLIEASPAISDEYEEEEFKRIENNLCKQDDNAETCCDVAFAYQLSQIQKYLREYDSDVELIVRKDYIAVLDKNCREYRGNVEQILRFIKADSDLRKVQNEMMEGI